MYVEKENLKENLKELGDGMSGTTGTTVTW